MLNHKSSARLFGYVFLCVIVFEGAGKAADQAHSARTVKPHPGATGEKAAERPEVARFRKRVETVLVDSGPDKGFWGVLVTDATTGEIYYERDTDKFFFPASNVKLFTTAFALAMLGPSYRERTTIVSSGQLEANGLLDGDLALIGSGDANLSNRKFPYDKKMKHEGPPEKVLAEFADTVAARGVKEISGDVIGDDSLFQSERFPSGWTIDDMLWSYGAAVSAIAVNDNTFTMEVWPGGREGDPSRVEAGFAANFYTIENSVRTGPSGSVEQLSVARDPDSRVIRLSGAMPARGGPRVLTIAIEDPAEYAAKYLARLLESRGIKIDGVARARHAGDPAPAVTPSMQRTVIAEHISPALADDVFLTNKDSENLHAELQLLVASHEKAGTTTYEEALKLEKEFFNTAGIPDGDVVLSDGSGLSRKDLVTPRAIVRMLRYAATQPWGDLYRSSLPVAGEDGTLSDRMKNTAAAGRVFAKTGTIGHVNSLSGYATTVRGAHLLFSILGSNNNLKAQDANRVLDAIVVAMVEELGPAK